MFWPLLQQVEMAARKSTAFGTEVEGHVCNDSWLPIYLPSNMDPKYTSNQMPDQMAAMFQNATIDKAKGNEFSNTAGDMFKFMMNQNNYYNFNKGENLILESSDPINHLLKVIPHFLAEVRKNDQNRSTDAETSGVDGHDQVPQNVATNCSPEGDPVDVIDLVPPEPSLLPVASIADRYTRSMLKCLVGYPLYEPQPLSELSTEYLRHGVNVGDVGFVRGNGTFDFLFNVCPSKNGSINPPNLPECFILDSSDISVTQTRLRTTCLFQNPVMRTKSDEYICEGSEGAILELPEGAVEEEAMNIRPFSMLAARQGVQWYEYTMARGRDIPNGSLYLITSSTKCAQWGIAVFDRKCSPGQGLKFDKKRTLPFGKSTTKYNWKGSRVFHTKVSGLNQGDTPNQCVFLRGYKIMIRQDIFDDLGKDQRRRFDEAIPSSSSRAGSINVTRQRATRIRGGGGPDPTSKRPTIEGLFSLTSTSITNSDEITLHANFNTSLVHPSDIVNAALLSLNPGAKVALTYDDVWRDLLRDNFPKLDYMGLVNISRLYTIVDEEYGCITLKRISRANIILEDSHCGVQEIETSLPGSITSSVDNYTPISDEISVTIPRELVERILLLLDTRSMLTCRLVNREFNEIIQSSTLLQYFLACKAAGALDNPRSPLSYGERLEALKRREDAWRKLKPVFEIKFDINHQAASSTRPTGGALFVDDNNRKDLNYCRLPSSPQENLHWIRIPGHGPALDWSGILVNFTTAIDEHDLIVNFISSDTGDQPNIQRYSLDFVLLQFSTGEYHPLARHPRIHVQRSTEVKPRVLFKIVGDTLALIIRGNNETFPSQLFIFDWKTGHKRLQHESTTERAYAGVVFVSPEFLLVPNQRLSHFEVWHLPHEQLSYKPPIQILCLQIPIISPGYSIREFRCNGEPNIFLHSAPYLPPRPFSSSPEDSIIMFTLRMSSDFFENKSFNFIMHRRALLDVIQDWTSPSLLKQRGDLPTWLTNEFTLFKTTDPEDGSATSIIQSKLVSMRPQLRSSSDPGGTCDSPTFAIDKSSPTTSPSTTSSTTRYDILQVPWTEWGPPISRWFQINYDQARWMPLSSGQRYVFPAHTPDDREKCRVAIADFNPHNYRRNGDMIARLKGGEDDDGNEKEEEEENLEIFDHGGVFQEEVYMGLKCVIHRAPDEYDFDLVWMDEERLFGVKLNHAGWEESIKVLYIG